MKNPSMKNFGDKIKHLLSGKGYNYRVIVFPRKDKIMKNGKRFIQEYEKVVIYAGRNVGINASKRSKKLVAWKNPNGEWEGDLEIAKQQGYKGSAIYLIDYHDRVEPVKHTLFSDLYEENEKEFGGQEAELLKIMANWRFQETERWNLEGRENEKKL